ARLAANENQLDRGVRLPLCLGVRSVEADFAGGGARTGVNSLRQQSPFRLGRLLRLGIEDRLQQLVEVVGWNALRAQSVVRRDQPLVDEVDGYADGCKTGALGIPRLQHPDPALLDCEF